MKACLTHDGDLKKGKSKCQHCDGRGYFIRHKAVFLGLEFRGLDDGERDVSVKCPVCHGLRYLSF